ncbi:MAG: hypothetical protein GQ570_11815 [Helicobacteraceae bacterium]|nr:hypothetical protein [Helicobacteraceae bacterium]
MNTLMIVPDKPRGFKEMSIIFGNGKNTNSRNSRDIHKYLKIDTAYSRWIKRRINTLGAVEDIDFSIANKEVIRKGKFSNVDYIVTKDFALKLIESERYKKKSVKSNVLYLITDGEYTKIGVTVDNATNRLSQCQTGNPKKLWIDFEIILKHARKAEKNLHKIYKDSQLIGEWFKLTDDDIKSIKKYARSL